MECGRRGQPRPPSLAAGPTLARGLRSANVVLGGRSRRVPDRLAGSPPLVRLPSRSARNSTNSSWTSMGLLSSPTLPLSPLPHPSLLSILPGPAARAAVPARAGHALRGGVPPPGPRPRALRCARPASPARPRRAPGSELEPGLYATRWISSSPERPPGSQRSDSGARRPGARSPSALGRHASSSSASAGIRPPTSSPLPPAQGVKTHTRAFVPPSPLSLAPLRYPGPRPGAAGSVAGTRPHGSAPSARQHRSDRGKLVRVVGARQRRAAQASRA